MDALVLGGSGLVGTALLKQLAEHIEFSRIVAAVRSPLPQSTPATIEQFVFSDLFECAIPNGFQPDVVFCCVGTTIKKAGSQEAFKRIDHDLVLAVAKQALSVGTTGFVVVSSLGADAKSRVFYSRVKGEMEVALKGLNFTSLHIVQPSLLLGDRPEQRLGEQLASLLMQSFKCVIPKRFRALHADEVAAEMIRLAVSG